MDMTYLTPAALQQTVGTSWKVLIQGTEIDLTLMRIRPGHELPIKRGASFSLIFKGPRQPVLPAQACDLKHPALGLLPMVLLTPILAHPTNADEMAAGMLYEVVFS